MPRIPESELLKGSGVVTRFDFKKYDSRFGRMTPYGKGFLHADVKCAAPKACREKSHAVFFTFEEVIKGRVYPEVGTEVLFVALPAKRAGDAPRAIALKPKGGERERPEKTVPGYVTHGR